MSERDRQRRIFGLLIALSRGLPLTAEQIFHEVEGYRDEFVQRGRSAALLKRFERDRQTLTSAGIALQVVPDPTAPGDRSRWRYQLSRDPGAGTELELSADERLLADRATLVWDDPEVAAEARAAYIKLLGVADSADAVTAPAQSARLSTGPVFADLRAAAANRRRITVGYRKVSEAEPQRRRIEPLQLGFVDGHWLVTAIDLGRGEEQRTFLMSRMSGPVTDEGPARVLREQTVDLPSHLAALAQARRITVDVRRGSLLAIRLGRKGAVHELDPERVRITYGAWDEALAADELAGAPGDVFAIASTAYPGLRDAVRGRWQLALSEHDGEAP